MSEWVVDAAPREDASSLSDRLVRVAWLPWAVAFAGLLAFIWMLRGTFIDDAYITFQYSRTLAEHGTWGFYEGRPANTATSPLNVLVTAGAGLPFGSMVTGAVWLTAAILTATLYVLLRLSRHLAGSEAFGAVAFAGLVANPLLLSGIGLEGYLFTLLLLGSLLLFVERRWYALGIALGLLTLARPDGVLLLLILLPALPRAGWFRSVWRIGVAYGLTLLPWALFSWVVLGSVVPDTLVIKLEQSAWGPTTFADGPELYELRYPLAFWGSVWMLAFAPFALGPLARMAPAGRRAMLALGLYGVAHYLAYSAMEVPPYHWYYTSQVVPIVVFGALGLTWLAGLVARSLDVAGMRRAARLAPALLPVIVYSVAAWDNPFPLKQALIHSNWATPGEYREIGEWLNERINPDTTIVLAGEIGTIAYYSDRYVIDDFADPNRTTALIEEWEDDATPVVEAFASVNFAWRDRQPAFPTPTYEMIFSPHVGPNYDDPHIVAQWPVSSRWIDDTTIFLRRITAAPVTVYGERTEDAGT